MFHPFNFKRTALTLLFILSTILFNFRTSHSQTFERLEFHTTQHGWENKESSLTIMYKSGKYLDENGNIVDESLVKNLLLAINEPPVADISFINLGITQSWLRQRAESALNAFLENRSSAWSPRSYSWPQEAKHLFIKAFTDSDHAEELMRHYYHGGGWTDDYPHCTVKIIGMDGAGIAIESYAQHPFMIPWRITKEGHSLDTYNANISKAIAAFLSDGFVNRQRVAGTRFEALLAWQIYWNHQDQIEMLIADEKIGRDIQGIKDRYSLKTSTIDTRSSIDLEMAYGWNATMTRNDLPLNVLVGIHIPMDNATFRSSVDPFLSKGDYYVELAMSVPWFKQYINSNPDIKVEIRFVEDRSLSKKAGQSLLEDMRGHGKGFLADKIVSQLQESSFVEVIEADRVYSRWIVLPDKRMLLWHFRGKGVLNWSASQFKGWERYGSVSVCVLFSPDGTILKEVD